MTDEVMYSSLEAPALKTKVVIFADDGKTVKKKVDIQFQHGAYRTSDPDVIAELDKHIATKPNFAQLVKKLDRNAALRVSEEWQKTHASQNMVARGGTDSESANLARRAEQVKNEAISEGLPEHQAQKLAEEMKADENYVMPETVEPKVSSPREGFIAGDEGKPADPAADISDVIPAGTDEQIESAKEIAGAPSMKKSPFA